MTILKGKYRVKNSENGYDIVHLETSASQVKFDDGKSFQDKLNSGELKGDKGDTGAKGDKGDKGDKGETGANGKDGLTTSVTVGGVKYTHTNGNITLPSYPTLSSLGGEPANSNIQTHIASPHAPANAQKNSDITKAEIEAKLTGTINTHTHDYSKLTNKPDLSVYATQTYVNDKVADFVNSAPETLDTLQELASALGNDPNFATTVTNQIGTKADKNSVYTKSEVDEIVSSATSIDDGAVNTSNTWSSQKINTELNNKVSKETGKGLSTNDYTTAEKNKLAGLSNYVHPNTESMRHVTDSEKLVWNSKAEGVHKHNYYDLENLPDIPVVDVDKEYVDLELSKKASINDEDTSLNTTWSSLKIDEAIDKKLSSSGGGQNIAYDKIIQASDWTLGSDGNYYFTVEHNIGSSRIFVSGVDVNREAILIGYKIINENTIQVNFAENIEVHVTIVNGDSEIKLSQESDSRNNFVCDREVLAQDWIIEDGLAKTTVTHRLFTEKILVNAISLDTKESLKIGYKIIDDLKIEVFTLDPVNALITIVNGEKELLEIRKEVTEISDSVVSSGYTWSSKKIQEEISNRIITWDDIVGKPTEFNPIHHNHNDLYYRKTEIEPVEDEFIDSLFGIFPETVRTLNVEKRYYTANEVDEKINKLMSIIDQLIK